MMYEFLAWGHKNILATHKSTFEFTKDKEVSLKGNCIIGVRANFVLRELKDFINQLWSEKIKIIIKVNNYVEEVVAYVNKEFWNSKTMVVRKSDFVDKRTLAVKANKAAVDLDRKIVSNLRKGGKIKVSLVGIE